ncbi:hypothetical protein EVAR_23081_1 [Eumeta japonica]|uniref:Uncharacterized protein n=1 Tax=Eumeta variegata TaxID=151549 RepID=A0A4C1VPS0_EUMVA|nr:hypothetical protein EVAR_23081_1 [Eumeta japonica]
MADDNVLFAVFMARERRRAGQSQRDSRPLKGSRPQLDFWLGARNNTIGYRPVEISDLNRSFLGFSRELGRERWRGVILPGNARVTPLDGRGGRPRPPRRPCSAPETDRNPNRFLVGLRFS